MTHGRIALVAFACLGILGCSESSLPLQENADPATPLAGAFDPAATGEIRGRVVWDGDVPIAEETTVRAIAFKPNSHATPLHFTTPHAPKVDSQTRGVENAVVFVRHVDLARSKAWDLPPVRVEFHERQLEVVQGSQRSSVGFVRRGCAIEIENRESDYHNLHGRGADFFAIPLIKGGGPFRHTLSRKGLVDLTCGAGYYWLHAHLFVAEHPYFTRTDAAGRFALTAVPAGTYEVVCWLPNWRVEQAHRDPEMAVVARLTWARPREQSQSVDVKAGQQSEVTYRWTRAMFAAK